MPCSFRVYTCIAIILILACNPLRATAQRFSDSELGALLKNDCGSCHGLTRKGGLGPPLLPRALQNKTDEYLFTVIQYGIPNTAMPAWKRILNREETLRLIRQIRDDEEANHAKENP